MPTLLFSTGRYTNCPKFNNLLIRRMRTTKALYIGSTILEFFFFFFFFLGSKGWVDLGIQGKAKFSTAYATGSASICFLNGQPYERI